MILRRVIFLVVYTHHKHRRVGRWRRDDDLFGAAFEMRRRLVDCRKDARRLDHIIGAIRAPSYGK